MDCLYIVLAGEKGEGLMPLTTERPASLLRFGTGGALIDSTIFNCLSSGGRNTIVLTQNKAWMVGKYVNDFWSKAFAGAGLNISCLPFIETPGSCHDWNTVDAIHQALLSLRTLRDYSFKSLPDYIVVLPGDQVYRMDYRRVIDFHRSHGKTLTIAAVPYDPTDDLNFGIMRQNEEGKITMYVDKPERPKNMESASADLYSSTGIYIFTVKHLFPFLKDLGLDGGFEVGKHVIRAMIRANQARIFHFGSGYGETMYWRKVKSLFSYWQAHMDMLDLRNGSTQPVKRAKTGLLPFSRNELVEKFEGRNTKIINSAVSRSASIGKAVVERSIIAPGACIADGAIVKDSIVLDGSRVNKGAVIDKLIAPPLAEIREEGLGCLSIFPRQAPGNVGMYAN